MYKIVYIDEQPDDIDNFKDYVDRLNTKQSFQVKDLLPLAKLDQMIEAIAQENPDAIVTDFQLNEYKVAVEYNVPYNGVELVKEFQAIREGFPCFVLTSFDMDAIHESDDVNIVYIKDLLQEGKSQASIKFLERVEAQIGHYRARIKEAEDTLTKLIALKQQGKATVQDEEEIIRLDHLLERSLDKRQAIPDALKSISNSQRLDSLLSKVDNLLNHVIHTNEQAIPPKRPKKDL